jgi:hypothetical protein
MVIAKNGKKHNIKIGKQQIEQVETVKYLGVQINQEGRIDEEINTRIASSSKLSNSIRSGFLNHKEITEKTKLSVYKSTFSPILSFASETWVLNKEHKSKIQTLGMWFLRKVVGKTRYKIRNETTRRNLGVPPLQIEIEESRLRWAGHVLRMGENE